MKNASINLETSKPERGKLDSFSGFMASEFNQILCRPNPLGLHPVTVREMDGTRVKIGPIEAFDGTRLSISSQRRRAPTGDGVAAYNGTTVWQRFAAFVKPRSLALSPRGLGLTDNGFLSQTDRRRRG
ncbi:MAG: hypothetical protein M3Q89_07140 [Verrucomicrobiota bacterium]|nr:hypothetical protein [Verrucomicrobiota bacterium]